MSDAMVIGFMVLIIILLLALCLMAFLIKRLVTAINIQGCSHSENDNKFSVGSELWVKYMYLDIAYDLYSRHSIEVHRYINIDRIELPGHTAYINGYVDGLEKASNIVVNAIADALGIDQSEVYRHFHSYEL